MLIKLVRGWLFGCMRLVRCSDRVGKKKTQGFTLAEVVMSLAIASLSFSGVIYGYVLTSNQAQWSSCSLAAQSLATQGVEQARAAKWDPQAWPSIDELGTTNFTTVSQLDVPVAGGNILFATNFISVNTASTVPPLRQLRADCVWRVPSGAMTHGIYTNTVITLRAPDQ
jgi:prepilin-type N-terminal cleavage/methylation domain-containing protein